MQRGQISRSPVYRALYQEAEREREEAERKQEEAERGENKARS